MKRKKKEKNKLAGMTGRYPNLPTMERMAHGSITIRNAIAQADDPLRIDKLRNNGIIDDMQHLYGMQIITLWTIANRPFLRTMTYAPRIGSASVAGLEHINLSRMSAEDQLYKTLGFLRPRDHALIGRICFEEQGAIEAGRALGLPVNTITVYVRAAFDALGTALAKMRDIKKELRQETAGG